MGRNFVFGCVLVFSFCFHAKSGTTNNHRTGLSDISYGSPYSRDSNHIKKILNFFPSVEEKKQF